MNSTNNSTNIPNVQQKNEVNINTAYGVLTVSDTDVEDHATMRARQLSSLLLFMHVGDGLDNFRALGKDTQESLMWLTYQLADEVEQMVRFCTKGANHAPA